MDQNTRDVLVAAVGALGGLVVGIGVAWIGFRFSRSLEADRRQHEAATRWLVERRERYARYLAAANAYREAAVARLAWLEALEEGETPSEPARLSQAVLEEPYQELRLIAPRPVREAAAALLAVLVIFGSETGMEDGTRPRRTQSRADVWGDQLGALSRELVRACHIDLGVEPDDPDGMRVTFAPSARGGVDMYRDEDPKTRR